MCDVRHWWNVLTAGWSTQSPAFNVSKCQIVFGRSSSSYMALSSHGFREHVPHAMNVPSKSKRRGVRTDGAGECDSNALRQRQYDTM